MGIHSATFQKPGFGQKPRFGAGLPVTPLRWRERQKDVLLSTDIDHTLLGWLNDDDDKLNQQALDRTIETLKHHRKDLAIHLNTGRGLTALKAIAPFLKGVPVDYLSLNNGQELYINRRKHRDAASWIAGLKPSDQVRFSRQALTNQGWNTPRAMRILADVFKTHGFTPNPKPQGNAQYNNATYLHGDFDGQRVTLEYYPDQPGFFLQPNITMKDGRDIAQTLADDWQQRLDKEGLNVHLTNFYSGADDNGQSPTAISMGFPDGLSKATAVEELIQKRLPNLDGVITAGDSATNDYALVAPEHYAHTLPNYPIVSGKSGRLAQKMTEHPRAIHTYIATLAPAIERHVQSIHRAGQKLNAFA